MEFGNPIVGQEELIREAIKSKNFSTDPETGVTGWRIARDGSATFYNLTVGSDSYFIDEDGNAVFNSISATDITLDGTNLNDILNDRAKGILAVVTVVGDSAVHSGTNIAFGRIVIPNFDPTRQYRVGATGRINMSGTVANYVGMRCRYAWDAEATASSPILYEEQDGGRDDTSTSDWIFNTSFTFSDGTPGGTDMHLLFTFFVEGTGGNFQSDGFSRVWTEDCGLRAPITTYDVSTDVPPTQQYTKEYTAVFSDSFQEDGTDRNVGELYQGHFSSTNGNQYSLVMFDHAQMRADLAGAVIDDIDLYLNNNHSYFNAGMTAIIGTHDKDNIGGNQSYTNVNPDRTRESFNKGEAKWVDIPNSIGEDFRDGLANGILLGKGPNNDNEYYGYFAGYDQSGPPKIRIDFTK